MQKKLKPSHIWGGIFKEHYRSLFVLAIVAIQFYIRNGDVNVPDTRDGIAISWVLFGICIATLRGTLLLGTGMLFTGVMLYTFADNILLDNKYFGAIDLYLAGSCFAAWVVWLAYEYHKGRLQSSKKETTAAVLALTIILVLLLGINYQQYYPGFFSWLHWDFDMKGGPFYRSDAFAHILAALLFIYTTRRLDRLFGLYYLVMASYNYVDEMYYNPTVQSDSEWLGIIIIHIAFTAGLLWYLRRRLLPAYRG